MKEGYVKSETHLSVTTIEFYCSHNNSLPFKILEDLAQEIHFAGNHPETKVIVLRSGDEPFFCSGADLEELYQIHTEAEGFKYYQAIAHLINAMRKCPKFIIGRIHGKTIGGGVGLVACLDYAIAIDKAEIKLSELAFNIGPFVIGPAIERKIGVSAFETLAIDTHGWRTADWSKRKGLFSEVHIGMENMDESIQNLANSLSHSSPDLMREMKKMFWRGTEHWDELLKERAIVSGRQVIGEFTKSALQKALSAYYFINA